MSSVYLAGPIRGLTYKQSSGWRERAAAFLTKHSIVALSPLRYNKTIVGSGPINDSDEAHPLTSEDGITARDRMDVMRCDVILANFLGATQASCGTPIEFGWADILRKPVIMVMEPDGNPFDHGMMRAIAGYRVASLEEGLALCVALLA